MANAAPKRIGNNSRASEKMLCLTSTSTVATTNLVRSCGNRILVQSVLQMCTSCLFLNLHEAETMLEAAKTRPKTAALSSAPFVPQQNSSFFDGSRHCGLGLAEVWPVSSSVQVDNAPLNTLNPSAPLTRSRAGDIAPHLRCKLGGEGHGPEDEFSDHV